MTQVINPVKALIRKGAYFQLPMILIWLFRLMLYGDKKFDWADLTTPPGMLEFIGLTLMAVSMVRIYSLNTSKKLITSDIFALTRHPMYHGMFIADSALFFHANLSDPVYWLTWFLFVFLLFMAGWFQEKETLARWGTEAEAYYAKTPRFISEWLWRWIH